MTGTEAELRAALQSAYGSGDGYLEQSAVQRIVVSVRQPPPRGRLPGWPARAALAAGAIVVAVLVILTLLSSSRGAVTGAHPAARPNATAGAHPTANWSVSHVIQKGQFSLGWGVAAQVMFEGHGLTTGTSVTVSIQQSGIVTEIISTTVDANGDARSTVAMPAAVVDGSANFIVCLTPPNGSRSCEVLPVTLQTGHGSAAASTPGCPPGTTETGRSTPAPNGQYWIDCLGTAPRSP